MNQHELDRENEKTNLDDGWLCEGCDQYEDHCEC